jgi:hypothetical protein
VLPLISTVFPASVKTSVYEAVTLLYTTAVVEPPELCAKLAVVAKEADTEFCAKLDVPNRDPVIPPVTFKEPVI